MKKVFSVLAVVALFASVVACGNKKAEEVAPVEEVVEVVDTTVAEVVDSAAVEAAPVEEVK